MSSSIHFFLPFYCVHRIISILTLAFASTILFSQSSQNEVDSLNHVIQNSYSPVAKSNALVRLADLNSTINIDTMPILCNQALKIIEQNLLANDDLEKRELRRISSEAYNNIGYYHIRKGNLEKAITPLTKSINIALEIEEPLVALSSGMNLSIVYAEQGDYRKALEVMNLTDEIAKTNGYIEKRAIIKNNIGWVYQMLKVNDASLRYYRESYNMRLQLDSNSNGIATALNNMGIIHMRLGDIDSALICYEKALQISQNSGNKAGEAHNLANLAKIYLEYGDTITATEYYEQSLKIWRSLNIKRGWLNTLNAYGKLLVAQKKVKQAALLLTEFDTLLPTYNTPVSRREYYQFSYLYHELIGNLDRAFFDLRTYQAIKDSSQIEEIKHEVIGHELRMQNESEKKLMTQEYEHQLDLRIEVEKRQRLQLYLLLSFLAIVLVVFLFTWKYFRQRQLLAQQSLEITRIKNEKLKENVRTKNKELTAYTLRVAQNNQFLQRIEEIIESVNSASKNEIENQLRELKTAANINKRRDKDWLEFQKQFEGIHTSFISNLKEKYPKLSAGEIRLCTLIKLNLNSKDIASVLGVSMNTLKSSRYRIHKKIGLEKGQELADFILGFH